MPLPHVFNHPRQLGFASKSIGTWMRVGYRWMPVFTRYHAALHFLRSPRNTWGSSNEADAPVLSQLVFEVAAVRSTELYCRERSHIKGTRSNPAIALEATQSFVCAHLPRSMAYYLDDTHVRVNIQY